ncbi:MAG: ATP-binding protein [Lachnospiraceae bacterium]|nr:ATP-binding protein [Lachnospiraceae bacterium]
MNKPNPYRPGAGLMPTYVAGRDEIVSEVSGLYEAMLAGIPVQSVIISGLRGVGKTVLINRLQAIAEEAGVFTKYIEIEEKKDFISQIASCAQAYLREAEKKEKLKNIIRKGMDAIKALSLSFDPNSGNLSLSVQDRDLYHSYNLPQSLTDVFQAIGEVAQKTEHPVCFFVDEIQYMRTEELGALISALHRSNQLGYPLIVIGAGLPKLLKMLADEKSYAERLFTYHEIGSLTEKEAELAICEPAKKIRVTYEDTAVRRIIEITKGYPFYVQQFCQIVFQRTEREIIALKDVEDAVAVYYHTLDGGFFRARYERCSDTEKEFTFAMAKCGSLPCEIAEVARILGRKTTSVSPYRAKLINKGIVYAVRHSALDFTVPEYDAFLRRCEDFHAWDRGIKS